MAGLGHAVAIRGSSPRRERRLGPILSGVTGGSDREVSAPSTPSRSCSGSSCVPGVQGCKLVCVQGATLMALHQVLPCFIPFLFSLFFSFRSYSLLVRNVCASGVAAASCTGHCVRSRCCNQRDFLVGRAVSCSSWSSGCGLHAGGSLRGTCDFCGHTCVCGVHTYSSWHFQPQIVLAIM